MLNVSDTIHVMDPDLEQTVQLDVVDRLIAAHEGYKQGVSADYDDLLTEGECPDRGRWIGR